MDYKQYFDKVLRHEHGKIRSLGQIEGRNLSFLSARQSVDRVAVLVRFIFHAFNILFYVL